jgi:hypothetical protein
MLVEDFQRLARKLTENDEAARVQRFLESFRDALLNLQSSPADISFQEKVASARNKFLNSFRNMFENISESEMDRIASLGGLPYFTDSMIEDIEDVFVNNAMTPAVAAQFVSNFAAQRGAFIEKVKANYINFQHLGFSDDSPQENEAEVAFTLPRKFFENKLDNLTKRLTVIDRMIKHICEVNGEGRAGVEIRSISTSDPTFWIATSVKVAIALGLMVSWALDQIKKAAEIDLLRAQTENLKSDAAKTLAAQFEEITKAEIERAISERLAAEFGDSPRGRQNELKNERRIVLESILAMIERGVTIEIKAPIEPPTQNEDEIDHSVADLSSELREIARTLRFPPPSPNPLVQLPQAPGD